MCPGIGGDREQGAGSAGLVSSADAGRFRRRDPARPRTATGAYRQLGSQICMFQVDWEMGRPVRIGYSHAKLVMTTAT